MRIFRRLIIIGVLVVIVGGLSIVGTLKMTPSHGQTVAEMGSIQEGEKPGQIYEGYVFYNEITGEYESMEPLPEAEPIDETYVKVALGETVGPVGMESALTPTNNSDTEYMLIDSDGDGKIKRLTIDCGMILGVSEMVYRGPIFVQVDIQKDGEWVFGFRQELNSGEYCQIILPKRSPFRCYLWKPEGNDWVCKYSYTSRWW